MKLSEISQPDITPPRPGDYAVFVNKRGQWELYWNCGADQELAQRERDWIVQAGGRAQVFRKK